MNMVLTIIAVLGLGALLISVIVFTIAARRYVSDDDTESLGPVADSGRDHRPRNREDRRQSPPPTIFPITINGEFVPEDRRRLPDRRRQSLQFA